ncbi:MAG: B12-binding domain-containing radical SAM protein, partial [Candidatus Methylomirabilales bacterium]
MHSHSYKKILFVNPRFPSSLWGFQGIAELVGVRSGQAPLGLATVAAMTPPNIEVDLQDENCNPVPLDTDADVVAIGCWSVQYGRARELAAEFRRRGKLTVVGGPYPTLCPERFADGAFDVVFDGEVEITWPQFCRDLAAGSPKPLYKQVGNVDMRLSPVPRFDLLRKDDYLYNFVQTTRGCPFQCEFCDIIITDGRVPRLKSIPQVLTEIEAIAALGGRYVSFSDANFIGNTKYAEQLLCALVEFGRANGFPLHFSAEMTINVAEKPRLLELLREANFTGIFVGIESPRIESLVETKKRQNVHKPLIESVRKMQSYNLIVTAGMIVGFDHDDVRIFQEQFDFLMEAGIPFTTCGVLTAIEKTPLYARLEKEGRLLPYDSALIRGHGAADLNFVPKLMTVEEAHRGYNWLIRALYKSENYGARLV